MNSERLIATVMLGVLFCAGWAMADEDTPADASDEPAGMQSEDNTAGLEHDGEMDEPPTDDELLGFGAGGEDEEGAELKLWEEMPVVVTASRREEPIDMAPNVMYVITADEIKKYGYHRPADVLVRVPGFYSFHTAGVHQQLFGVRGVSFGENIKIAFMINGHRINNVNADSSGVWPITLDDVERVEVLVGPGSVMYGADTLLATFNMITKEMDGGEVTWSTGITEFAKKATTTKDRATTAVSNTGSFMYGHSWDDDKSFFVSGTYAERDGWNTFQEGWNQLTENTGWGFTRDVNRIMPSYKIFTSVNYDDWFFQYHRLVQEIGRGSDHRGNYVDSFVLRHEKDHSDEFSTNFAVSVDNRRGQRRGEGLFWKQVLYKAEVGMTYETDEHTFQAGIQTNFGDNRNGEHRYYSGGPLVHEKVSTIIGGYLSDTWRINDEWSVIGAVRADHSNITQTGRLQVAPRAAVIYQPTDRWVLKAMYNSAIQFPDPLHSELAIFANRNRGYPTTWWPISGRPWLHPADKPERMQTVELQSIHYIGDGRLSMNVFYQQLKDVIAWYYSWTNAADMCGWGAEMDFKYPVTDRLNFWANAAFQDTKIDTISPEYTGIPYESPRGRTVGLPQFTFNTGADYAVTDNMTVTGTLRYLTEMPLVRQRRRPGYTEFWDVQRHNIYLDMTFLWEDFLTENLDLRLSGKNILNSRRYLPRLRQKGDYVNEGTYLEATLSYSW
ncbi:MAG: TonB-dependent receptor plug domain-containing protein [Phycisphaerae bacterium]